MGDAGDGLDDVQIQPPSFLTTTPSYQTTTTSDDSLLSLTLFRLAAGRLFNLS